MNMKKYAVTAAVAAVLSGTFAGTVPAFAAGVSTTIAAKQTAVTNAQKVVPAAAKLVSAKTDDNEFELEFLDPDTLERYEVEVDRATQKVKEVEVKSSNYPGSVTVSEDGRRRQRSHQRLVMLTPATSSSRKTDDKDGTPFVVYKATFETDAFTGEALLNPATCYIGYQELTYK